jgi:hypothetical protein
LFLEAFTYFYSDFAIRIKNKNMRSTIITKVFLSFLFLTLLSINAEAQRGSADQAKVKYEEKLYNSLEWRNIGPFRGGAQQP